MKLSLFLLFCVIPCEVTFGDSPMGQRPWIIGSKDGSFCFRMVPERRRVEDRKPVLERPPFGVASEITQDGELKEIWRIDGWYTFEGYLSEKGRYFVRIGPWAEDQEHHTDLAVAFYDRGSLLRQYQVKDLIKQEALLEDSVSHYEWRPVKQTEPTGLKRLSDPGIEIFHLVMIDKTTYDFDISTGKIISTDQDPGALSTTEIFKLEAEEAAKEGKRLLMESGRMEEFEAHFQLQEMRSSKLSRTYALHFEGREWHADLKPKKTLKYDISVGLCFKVDDSERLVIGLSADAIAKALGTITLHPYVIDRFSKFNAKGLRLRSAGGRLHWDADSLRALLTKVNLKENDLNTWAELVIDEPDHSNHSLFLNTQSGEIVREDSAANPSGAVRIGKDGKVVPH